MTVIELRLFFEALPEKAAVGNTFPTKRLFALESGVRQWIIQEIVLGRRSLTGATMEKLLPVMRRYGFQG